MTRFDAAGLVVGERALPFYAGAMHYWRVPPERWAACLRAIHALGLTIVETYVPWRVHEPAPGARAWTGERDLAKFLGLARAAGLAVVLRPGPHINAELTSFGMPDWALAEPACQARTARGTPAWLPAPPRAFPVPSYASAAFRAHVRAWYAQVAEIVRPFVGDPVVAIGVDNEAQLFFRAGAYDLDYHPDALAWWAESAGELAPPRAWDPANAATCVRWVAWKDDYLARALGELAHMLDELGLGELARFHNLPPGHFGLYDLRRIQRAIAGPVGIDAYTPRAQFPELRRRAAALVGNARPLPLALEVGVGFFPWLAPLDLHSAPPRGAARPGGAGAFDPHSAPLRGAARPGGAGAFDAADDPARECDHLLTLLAAGVRGFNLFMAVERDRYYGAAIDARGHRERHAAWIPRLVAALGEVAWPELRRDAPIAVIDLRADARFGAASSAIDPMTPVIAEVLELGPGGAAELGLDAGAIAARRWQTAVCRALELAQVGYAIVDESAGEDELAGYRAVIAPTGERIDRALWARLAALAEARRTVVVIGPGTPSRDEFDQPLGPGPRPVGRLKAGSLDDLAGLADDLAGLAGEASEAWQIERPDEVRAAAFRDRAGLARVVFVTSDAEHAVTAVLLADDRASALRDALTGEVVRVESGRASLTLPPRGVRMLIVAA
ncbi:MAG TPA: beta-galactosidase [Kofleriaceae bacterium]|nr:beta-galactosidase [Kofleriaceae bacterium]